MRDFNRHLDIVAWTNNMTVIASHRRGDLQHLFVDARLPHRKNSSQ